MTGYDLFVPLFVLLAMLLSKQPKRLAIAFCMCISLSKIPIELIENDLAFYIYAIPVEFIAGYSLIMAANHGQKIKEDRFFYRLMGVMFFVSAFVHYRFMWDYIEAHSTYVSISHTVGYIHVGLMMVYSDGAKRLVRTVYHYLLSHRLGEIRS